MKFAIANPLSLILQTDELTYQFLAQYLIQLILEQQRFFLLASGSDICHGGRSRSTQKQHVRDHLFYSFQ